MEINVLRCEHADCEYCIKRNICTRDVPKPCKYRYTEEERIADQASDRFGAILSGTFLPGIYHKKEEDEMKTTSVQTIKNVNYINFSIENYPMEMESKLTIIAGTDDDIFEFKFEGRDLLKICKAAGLFTGWEKDQKIRELEKDNEDIRSRNLAYKEMNNKLQEENTENAKTIKQNLQRIRELEEEVSSWKKEAAECLTLRDEAEEEYEEKIKELERNNMLNKETSDFWSKAYYDLSKNYDKLLNVNKNLKEEYEEKIKKLERKYNFERCANEAQHKFFGQYAGKGTEIEFNYAINDTTDEASYVIVDKEEYQSLKDHGYTAMIHGKIYNPVQLVDKILELENLSKQLNDRILKLEKLKIPTIENFADEAKEEKKKMTDGELRSCY